ncbi:MAG: hypothetical protein B7Z55_07760, partial [Planctomycetales bacterium 12-60-4]
MIDGLSTPFAECLTLTLLHFLWQGLLIGCVFWGWSMAAGDRSAQMRYLVGLALLAVMAVCPPLTFAVLFNTSARHVSLTSVDSLPTSREGLSHAPRLQRTETTNRGSMPGHARHPNRHVSAVSPQTSISRTLDGINASLIALQPYILLVWLAGVILSGARLTGGFVNVLWLGSGRIPVARELIACSSRLARRLQLRSARVFASRRIRQAAVVGFWRPVVLLPIAWLAELPPEVLDAVLAHELAHIRRLDVWVNLLQRLLETLLFYHPVVWWLSNQVRLERELCCDQLAAEAIGSRGNYVRALEHVGRLHLRGRMQLAAAFSGAGKMNLLSRIQYVLGVGRKPEREPSWAVGALAVATSLAIAGGLGGFPTSSVAEAKDREGGASAEAAAGPARSAEGQAGPRRSPEAEAGPQDRGPACRR